MIENEELIFKQHDGSYPTRTGLMDFLEEVNLKG